MNGNITERIHIWEQKDCFIPWCWNLSRSFQMKLLMLSNVMRKGQKQFKFFSFLMTHPLLWSFGLYIPCLVCSSAPFVKKKILFASPPPTLFFLFFFFLLRLSIYCIMNCRRRSSWTLNLWNLLILAEWLRGEVEKIVDWTLPHLEKTFLQQLNHPHFKELSIYFS